VEKDVIQFILESRNVNFLSHLHVSAHVEEMMWERLRSGLGYAAIYGINLLFVVKYAPRYGIPWSAGTLAYACAFCAILWVCRRRFFVRFFQQPSAYFAALFLTAAVLAFLMFQFDPTTRNARAPAINDWLARFLNGEYPYGSGTRPSGFPFLFVLALPFYLPGEVGWWQIVSFIVIGFLFYHARHSTAPGKIALLLFSPAFLYEVAVRSELFSNMVVVMLYLWIFERFACDRTPGRMLVLGLLGGLVLSTRGVVLIVYAVYFVYSFRRDMQTGLIFAFGVLASFAATILPFVVWDVGRFLRHGPLAIQTKNLPTPWIAVMLLLAVSSGVCVRSKIGVWEMVTALLFGSVTVSFILTLLQVGWSAAVWQDKFDISYFCFALSFLLAISAPSRRSFCEIFR